MKYRLESFVSRKLDFSDPEDAARILEEFGGEELLKTQYPELYAAFLRTREEHEGLRSNGPSEETGLESSAIAAPIALVGSGSTGAVNAAKQKGILRGITSVQGNSPWLSGTVKGYMKNLTQDVILRNFMTRLSGENYCQEVLERSSEDISSFSDQKIQNSIESRAVLANGTLECLESKSVVYVEAGGITPVVYMVIEDPKSKIGNDPIIMMYARTADAGEIVDYDYPNNRKYPDPSHAVKTVFPIKGRITFNNAYKPVKFSLENKTKKPMLFYNGQGVCEYNYSYEEIGACFSISAANPQVVEFQLKEDWKVDLDISAYTLAHDAKLGLIFSFFYEVEVDGDTDVVPITIYYTDDPQKKYYEVYDDTNVKIPYVYIKWGCFSKDTLIRLADGTEKCISGINIGDRLFGENRQDIRVIDIVRGEEESIYCIRTEADKLLCVTARHPVLTTEGLLRAEDIIPGHILCCADGTEDTVSFCYSRNYKDTVYNLITEGGSGLIAANGIWAGNFELQNSNSAIRRKEEPVNEEAVKAAQQLHSLMDYLETQNK